MNRTVRTRAGAVLVALLTLAVLSSRASPGFPLADVPKAFGRSIAKALGTKPEKAAPRTGGQRGASSFALSDIPRRYLGFYADAATECRGLTWQVLAAIGKIESDHGRSSAPGVRDGINRAGCCAGPMQFNLTNGPPSTWDTWGTGVRAQVYDPAHAVPAAARKLCSDGLARPEAVGRDPCPQVLGSAALHTALRRYNNACWYVHEVVTLAGRYTRAAPAPAPARDPFVRALVALVGEVGTAGEGERGADLGRAQGALEAVQPQGEGAGGLAAAADRAAVDHVDVDRPPDGVVGDPGGALHEPGVAGAQAAEADRVAVGQDGQQGLDPEVEPSGGQFGCRVAAVAGGGRNPFVGDQRPHERVA